MAITRDKAVSGEELQALLDEFESMTTVVEGKLSYTDFHPLERFADMLPDAFSVTPPLPRSQAMKLFSDALKAARRSGPLTSDSLLDHARRLEAERRDRRRERYTLWTKVRGRTTPEEEFSFAWDGVDVSITTRLAKWMHIEPYDNTGLGHVAPDAPAGSAYAIMTCDERDEEEAVNRMLEALQVVMALMNAYEARGRRTWLAGRRWTAGKLHLGPYHFVFKGRSFQGRSGTWYNPRYDEATWLDREPPVSDYAPHVPNVRLAIEALGGHPLRRELAGALVLMQDAFETTDGNHRLLRFWAALEKLYVLEGGRGQSNQQVIRRAAFADADHLLTSWRLRHVSRVRNEWVHARGHDGAHLSLGQELQDILTRHVLYWIFEGRDFASHAALLSYVDLPRHDADLLAMRAAVDRRLALNRERDS